MANFSIAIEFVLENEGGFCDNPSDPGGATAYGITAKYLMNNNLWRYDVDGDGVISSNDMRLFTKDNAITVYKSLWNTNYYDLLNNNELAKRVFDFSVNAGEITCIKILQSALNWFYGHKILEEDGILGTKTAEQANTLSEENNSKFISKFKSARANYYDYLVYKNPELDKFKDGWLKRSYR